jgi:hypothetical protein
VFGCCRRTASRSARRAGAESFRLSSPAANWARLTCIVASRCQDGRSAPNTLLMIGAYPQTLVKSLPVPRASTAYGTFAAFAGFSATGALVSSPVSPPASCSPSIFQGSIFGGKKLDMFQMTKTVNKRLKQSHLVTTPRSHFAEVRRSHRNRNLPPRALRRCGTRETGAQESAGRHSALV